MQINMLLKRLLQSSVAKNKGMTLIEMIVAMTVTLIILSLVMSILSSNRKLYAEDREINDTSQNLRIATDLVGIDAKKAGEGISDENFPVVSIKKDTNNNSELTLRLKVKPTVPDTDPTKPKLEPDLELASLPVCTAIDIDPTKHGDDGTVTGKLDPDGNPNLSNEQTISVATISPIAQLPQCAPTDADSNYIKDRIESPTLQRTLVPNGIPDTWENWRDYRCWQDGVKGCQGNSKEKLRAFIHDGQGNGQFFLYEGEDCLDILNVSKLPTCLGATNYIIRKSGSLVNDYGYGDILSRVRKASSEIHLLVEERKYSAVTNSNYPNGYVLQAAITPASIDDPSTQEITAGIDKFNIEASVKGNETSAVPALLSVFPSQNPYSTDTPKKDYTWKNLRGIKFYLKAKDPLNAVNSNNTNADYQKKLEISDLFLPRNTISCRSGC